jgi:hypothetical protein
MQSLAAALVLSALSVSSVLADPAVSTINGKLSAGAGEVGSNDFVYGAGSLTLPIGDSVGAQIDGLGGSIHGIGIWGLGGHLFWRDPDSGMYGLYLDTLHADVLGGIQVTKIGAEAEWFAGDWTVSAVTGWEGGDVIDRFWDRLDVTYYATDDFSVSLGHRYTLGTNAGVLSAEYQFGDSGFSLFATGRLGDNNSSGGWGGIKYAIGGPGVSLRDRARHDDPMSDLMETVTAAGKDVYQTITPPQCDPNNSPLGCPVP